MLLRFIKSAGFLLSTVLLIMNAVSCKKVHEEKMNDTVTMNNTLSLSDAQIQLANIKLCEAREGSIGQKLSLTGVLKVNEQSAVTISSRVTGRIEKLYFRNTGEILTKGDMLYEIYSEELISAQREFYRLQSNNWNYNARYEPSLAIEERLRVMGMTPQQIKQLGREGKILFTIPIYSQVQGKIRSVNVSEGQYVSEGQTLFELADDVSLWIEAQVYPDEIQFLKTGMSVNIIVPSEGELPVKSRISFINPSFETGKNITLVRAVIDNEDGRLHPGMFAIMNIQTQISKGIIIPASAVITGSLGSRVWVREESGEFSGRMVTTGTESGDSILVLSGLNKSDQIVTSGAYLLNSELILKQGSEIPGNAEQTNLTSYDLK